MRGALKRGPRNGGQLVWEERPNGIWIHRLYTGALANPLSWWYVWRGTQI